MGILDKVFSGHKGIVNVLAGKLGGTATITYQTGQTYNEETDSYSTQSSSVSVDAIPDNRRNGLRNSEGGIIVEDSDIILTVPSCQLQTIPTIHRDAITYNSIIYKITQIESNHVGNEVVSYKISGKR